MTRQITGHSTPSWRDIWKYIWRRFSEAKGFWGKLGVLINLFHSLIMVTIISAMNDLKKAGIVLLAIVTGVVFIAQLLRVSADPMVAFAIIVVGGLGLLIWFLRKRSKEKAAAINNDPPLTGNNIPVKGWTSYVITVLIVLVTIWTIYHYWTNFSEWWLRILGVIIFITVCITAYYKREIVKKLWRSEFLIVIAIAFGIATMNWLTWALDPFTWEAIHADTWRFWSINLGAFVGLIMRLIPKLDKDNKVVEGVHPIAKGFSNMVLGMTILTIGYMTWLANRVQEVQPPVKQISSIEDIPAEVALPIICGCESSGIPGVIKHYIDGTNIPLPHKSGESSAIGGCQILEKLHGERATRLGFNIRTPEGNLGYAKVLYNESSPHTRHWEGTPGNTTKSCWLPVLQAYGPRGVERTYVVKARVDEWSDMIILPRDGGRHSLDGNGKKYSVKWNDTVEEDLPLAKGAEAVRPDIIYNFRLKSKEKEDVNVVVRFY